MESTQPSVYRNCLYCKERVPPDAYFCCYCGARLPYVPKPEDKPILQKDEKVYIDKPGPFTPKTLAKYLSTSTTSIYKLVNDGELDCVRIGNRILIARDKVDEWLKKVGQRRHSYTI